MATPAIIVTASRYINLRTSLLCEALHDQGHSIRIISLSRGEWHFGFMEILELQPGYGNMIATERTPGDWGHGLVICNHWAVLPIALLLAILLRSKFIYDDHDFYVLNSTEALGRFQSRIKTVLISTMERLFVPWAALVTCIRLKDSALRSYLLRYNRNIVEINNYPKRSWLASSGQEYPADTPVALVYAGGIWDVKGCGCLMEAFVGALADCPDPLPELHFWGEGDELLMGRLRQGTNVYVHSFQRPETIRQFLHSRPCVGVALYENTPRYRLIDTNSHKFFEYLASGAPVLCTAVGELPGYIRTNNVGVITDYSVTAITANIRFLCANRPLLRQMSQNAVEMIRNRNMVWESEVGKFNSALSGDPL